MSRSPKSSSRRRPPGPGRRTARPSGRASIVALAGALLPALGILALAPSAEHPAVRAAVASPGPGPQPDPIWLLEIEGVINPLTARYLERGVREAAEAGAQAVVVRLDTPGGLDTSMREMTETMLNADVPVVVYVAPRGARAASAGMFLTMAGHVAAMAPGTNIGAAHPVGLGGGEADETTMEKIVNDASALARAIATERERNVEWAEEAVRQSVSITADEALQIDVIDLIAGDLDALLAQIDGRTLRTAAGDVTLRTADAPVRERSMTLAERILHVITDPNVAYILFTVGMIGLIAELYNPGTIFPGATGAVALILAFVAFGSLPINWAGGLLVLIGIALFVADLYSEGLGVLAAGGLVAFVLGSLMLYRPFELESPATPALQVSPWVIAVMAGSLALFFLLIVRALVRMRRSPVAIGRPAIVGRTGTATSELAPQGRVRVNGEEWSAIAEDGPIPPGTSVEVTDVEGVILRVRKR